MDINLQFQVKKCEILPSTISDHNTVILQISKQIDTPNGKGLWKFNKSLLKDQDYVSKVKTLISSAQNNYGNADPRIFFDTLKAEIRGLSISHGSHIAKLDREEEKLLTEQLKLVETEMIKNPDLIENYNLIKSKLRTFQLKHAAGQKVRARERYIDLDERPTEYFLAQEKSHGKVNNPGALYRPDKSLTNDNEEILSLQHEFYKDLYTNRQINLLKANKFMKDLPKLTEEMKNRICREITDPEIAEALLALPNNKSPGCDGLTADFYKKFWPDIKNIVCNSIRLALQSGELSIEQKRGVITLIPKSGKDLRFLQNWRPISLLNTDYKILAKLLALRLQPILPDIINGDQSAYIKGRNITDNIRLVWDVIDVTALTKKQLFILFIDFEKAFDTVSHEYLFKCLEHSNFGVFTNYVKLLYNDAQSCVSNRGYHSNYFHLSRGVRQGDPLSALLFIFILESFAITLRKDNKVKGFQFNNIVKKIFLYADDMSLLARDRASCEQCFLLLQEFELASGLKLNMSKTEGFSINCPPLNHIKIKWNPDSFKYLGILLCPDISKAHKLNLDRALKLYSSALQMWSHRKLTFTGKKTILNVNALSKIYHIQAS
jgi:hypothetical protein